MSYMFPGEFSSGAAAATQRADGETHPESGQITNNRHMQKQPSHTPPIRPAEHIAKSKSDAAAVDLLSLSFEGRTPPVDAKPNECLGNECAPTSELAASAVGNREPEDQQQLNFMQTPRGASRSRSGSGSDKAGRSTGDAKRVRRDRSGGVTESKSKSKPWWMV